MSASSAAAGGGSGTILDVATTFAAGSLGLDRRLLKAVAKLGYVHPTLVQSTTIPLALAGRDCLIKARTGSGKTAAFCLAVLQKLLQRKADGGGSGSSAAATRDAIRAVILVPTRELVDQTAEVLAGLTYYCSDVISFTATGGTTGGSIREQYARLQMGADIVVATPSRLVAAMDGRISTEAADAKPGKRGGGSAAAAASLLSLAAVDTLVIDEADLVLSFGHDKEVRRIVSSMPPIGVQALLVSATLSPELEALRALVLHSPAIVKLDEGNRDGTLTQYFVRIGFAVDRYLLLYALLKLRLIAGKALVFVNSVPAAFRLRLFLERFSISAAVLNAELPANSRTHILRGFNRGDFTILIATDEAVIASEHSTAEAGTVPVASAAAGSGDTAAAASSDGAVAGRKRKRGEAEAAAIAAAETTVYDAGGVGPRVTVMDEAAAAADAVEDASDDDVDDDDDANDDAGDDAGAAAAPATKRLRRSSADEAAAVTAAPAEPKPKKKKGGAGASAILADEEFGVSRGVDFRGVTTVINFDFPHSASSYIHRIGRTARGGASGVALSFIEPAAVREDHDAALTTLQSAQPPDPASGLPQPSPLPFNVAEVESFRYRVEGVLHSVTDGQVQEARRAEIRREIRTSEALKAHFEDNPRDADVLLKHDRPLAPRAIPDSLRHVPSYLLPPSLVTAVKAAGGGVAATDGAAASGEDRARGKREKRKGGRGRDRDGAGGDRKRDRSARGGAGGSDRKRDGPRGGGGGKPRDAVSAARKAIYAAHNSKVDPLKALAGRKRL